MIQNCQEFENGTPTADFEKSTLSNFKQFQFFEISKSVWGTVTISIAEIN